MRPAFGRMQLGGDFTLSQAVAKIDSNADDLGLGGAEPSLNVGLDLDWRRWRVSVALFDTSFAGSGSTTGSITLDGVTIGADVPVDAAFDTLSVRPILTRDVITTQHFALGLGLGLNWLFLDYRLTAQDMSAQTGTEFDGPVPFTAARLGYERGPFEIAATLGWLPLSIEGTEISIFDLDWTVSYRLQSDDARLLGSVLVGLRTFEVDAELDDSTGDVDTKFGLSGPYLGVGLSF